MGAGLQRVLGGSKSKSPPNPLQERRGPRAKALERQPKARLGCGRRATPPGGNRKSLIGIPGFPQADFVGTDRPAGKIDDPEGSLFTGPSGYPLTSRAKSMTNLQVSGIEPGQSPVLLDVSPSPR
jgi:hypothetical protein